MAEVSLVKLYSNECQWTLLMVNQHWFRQWLGAVRQQAITWANVDPDLCCHMASLGHHELTLVQQMAWCHQATSHHLSPCWLIFMSPYGITRPQWICEHVELHPLCWNTPDWSDFWPSWATCQQSPSYLQPLYWLVWPPLEHLMTQ